MAATVFDLIGPYVVEKGLPWDFKFTRFAGPSRVPVDLTDCLARLEFYDDQQPGSAPLVFSTGSGHISLGGGTGTFHCRLTGAETLAISIEQGRYRLVFTDSIGDEMLYLRGRLGFLEVGQ